MAVVFNAEESWGTPQSHSPAFLGTGGSNIQNQNQSTSSSSGNQQSTSSGSSFIPGYSQSPFMQEYANYARDLAGQSWNWAQNEYAKNSALTDSNVNAYLGASAKSLGLAQNLQDRYQQKFQPVEDRMIARAGQFNSDTYRHFKAGEAESGAGQAADANAENAKRDLASYGVNVDSGRYAALDQVNAAQRAATQAGAGQEALNTADTTSRQLDSEVGQMGARYPQAIQNAINTGYQGIAGAQNARLANTNTQANANDVANKFDATALSLKYPPLGNNTQSQSTGTQQSQSQSSGIGYQQPHTISSGPAQWPDEDGGGDSSYAQGGRVRRRHLPAIDTGDDYNNDHPQPNNPTQSDGFNTVSSDGWSRMDHNAPAAEQDNATKLAIAGKTPAASAYAQGGGIPDPDHPGGAVPQDASPSGGHVVDDVRANLNAGEFVIPKDVVQLKGHEFFHKLIEQSRKARVTGSMMGNQATAGQVKMPSAQRGAEMMQRHAQSITR